MNEYKDTGPLPSLPIVILNYHSTLGDIITCTTIILFLSWWYFGGDQISFIFNKYVFLGKFNNIWYVSAIALIRHPPLSSAKSRVPGGTPCCLCTIQIGPRCETRNFINVLMNCTCQVMQRTLVQYFWHFEQDVVTATRFLV